MLTLKANAKINFCLNVGALKNGMHPIESVAASVNIHDTVSVLLRKDNKINVRFVGSENNAVKKFELDMLNQENTNSAYRAAQIMQQEYGVGGVDIFIIKGIPIMGGLGGSSADAAAVIKAIDILFKLNLSPSKARLTALKVGSDVAFMLSGGFATVLGLGETVKKHSFFSPIKMVVAKGEGGVSTAQCYAKFDEIFSCNPPQRVDTESVVNALKENDIYAFDALFSNALFSPAVMLEPSIQSTIKRLKECGAACVFMSGSGSACVGVFNPQGNTRAIAHRLLREGLWAVCARTTSKGIVRV